jgi:hypothetical protein
LARRYFNYRYIFLERIFVITELAFQKMKIWFVKALFSLIGFILVNSVFSDESPKSSTSKEVPDKFIRMTMNPKRPKIPEALNTSIVRFVPKDDKLAESGIYVDLIGAIHIGDQKYFQQLNREFEKYDALLYEMVADKDSVGGKPVRFVERKENQSDDRSIKPDLIKNKKNASEEKGFKTGMAVVGGMQLGAKDMLGLAFQVDWIDYSIKNMVHADMSPEKFAETMDKRGESFLTLFMDLFVQGLKQQQGNKSKAPGDLALLFALFSDNRELVMKRIMAQQFAETDVLDNLGGENGSAIITERNIVAMNVLRKQLDKGEKKIGVFYGAGHLSDMSRRLIHEFDMKFVDERWIEAWDLRLPSNKKVRR